MYISLKNKSTPFQKEKRKKKKEKIKGNRKKNNTINIGWVHATAQVHHTINTHLLSSLCFFCKVFTFMYSIKFLFFYFSIGCPRVGGCPSPRACWAYPRVGFGYICFHCRNILWDLETKRWRSHGSFHGKSACDWKVKTMEMEW